MPTVHKTTYYTWSTPVFGYYRCSRCRSLNTFSVNLVKSSAAVNYQLSGEGKDRKAGKLTGQKQKLIDNADKGIYYMPCMFSGQCASCNAQEPWQTTSNRTLQLLGIFLPIALVIICFITGVHLWMLAAAVAVWGLIKLLSYLLAKSASDRCQSIDSESRPHFFVSESKMNEALQTRFPNEPHVENKKVFATPFW